MRFVGVLVVGVTIIGATHSTLGALSLFYSQVSDKPAEQSPRSVWDGVYTDEQATRGAQVYNRKCTSCHGNDFEGDGEASALIGNSFTAEWNNRHVGELFDRVRTTMPDDDPATLSDQAYVDVTAFILKINKFPSGKAELPPVLPTLNLVIFQAKPQE